MKKTIVLVLMIAMAAVLFTGCAAQAASVEQIAADEAAELQEITGSCEIEKIGDTTLRVHCTTNLIPTTKIAVALDNYKGVNLETEKLSVESESFTVDFEIEEDWEYPISATIICTPSDHGRQLKAVKETYGRSFQNMTGEDVLWNSSGNFVAIRSEEYAG